MALLDALRTGSWLTRERMCLVAGILLVACLAGGGWLLATANGLNDNFNRPLGTDFANVYTAGTYVLEGRPDAPFDPALQLARQRAIFASDEFYGWHYPPYFLFVAALLAMLPYLVALGVWQGVTLAMYLGAMRAVARWPDKLWLLLALAFPAVFINIAHGHNGFLTAALFTFALIVLDRRPVLAGVLFALIAYKPQFGVLIPIALAASGRWRTFASAALTLAALTLLVTLAFGTQVWTAFLTSSAFTREVVLEAGDTGWHKIQSVFSWVRMWGGSVALAYVIQAFISLAVAAAVAWIWRGRVPFALKASALLTGTLLATPYSLDYDLMLLAPAIAFLAADAMQRGFAPWEKTLLAALWIVPLFTRSVAHATMIPLAVPLMICAFIWTAQRARSVE